MISEKGFLRGGWGGCGGGGVCKNLEFLRVPHSFPEVIIIIIIRYYYNELLVLSDVL
jgi:hypothetical protein